MHKAHLSAGGAKSPVGRATAGRYKTLPGDACDACDACDAFSECTVYGEKIYSLENMFLRIENAVRIYVTSVTRWLITPHPALETNQGADKPISINVESDLRAQ